MVVEKRVRRMHLCADDTETKMAFKNHKGLSYREQRQENSLRNLRNSTEQKATVSNLLEQFPTQEIV